MNYTDDGEIHYGEDLEKGFWVAGYSDPDKKDVVYGATLSDAINKYFDKNGI